MLIEHPKLNIKEDLHMLLSQMSLFLLYELQHMALNKYEVWNFCIFVFFFILLKQTKALTPR